jgi:hypothetical protein
VQLYTILRRHGWRSPEELQEAAGRSTRVGDARAETGIPPAAEPASSNASTLSDGFDCGDAAVGGAGMLIVLTVGATAVARIRRTRGRGQPALTS